MEPGWLRLLLRINQDTKRLLFIELLLCDNLIDQEEVRNRSLPQEQDSRRGIEPQRKSMAHEGDGNLNC